MNGALDELIINGIKSNIELHKKLINDSEVRIGGMNIHYLENKLAAE